MDAYAARVDQTTGEIGAAVDRLPRVLQDISEQLTDQIDRMNASLNRDAAGHGRRGGSDVRQISEIRFPSVRPEKVVKEDRGIPAGAPAPEEAAEQDFWLSFSDLMSVLVLMFILVLFYILYKYVVIQGAYQQKMDDMLLVESALSEKEGQLTDAQSALDAKEEELTQAQKDLASQQMMLNLAKQAVSDSEEELARKAGGAGRGPAIGGGPETALADMESRLDAQQAQLDDQQAQLEALVGVRSRIIRSLSQTLKDNGISATVDPANGSIMFESDVFFEYRSDTLSAEGKAFIDRFLPVYLSVLFSPENEGYVSEIIIEGHTDTTDTYIKNLKLSQNRAYAVAEYVLESSTGVTPGQKTQLKSLLTANGRSYSDPILDANGNVDAQASRRVVFKFRLTDDRMIEQMRSILEESADDAQGEPAPRRRKLLRQRKSLRQRKPLRRKTGNNSLNQEFCLI